MSLDVFNKAVAIAKESKIPTLNFFGGEPLINPQIMAMLRKAIEDKFDLLIATNCQPLSNEHRFIEFLDATRHYTQHIAVLVAKDRFHLEFFDPSEVVDRLLEEGYKVSIQDYSNHTVALSEHNMSRLELYELNTYWSCCDAKWTDYVGILPNGAWTICPPSLEPFGNIFINSLADILDFKKGILFQNDRGCQECLKHFEMFKQRFELQNSNLK